MFQFALLRCLKPKFCFVYYRADSESQTFTFQKLHFNHLHIKILIKRNVLKIDNSKTSFNLTFQRLISGPCFYVCLSWSKKTQDASLVFSRLRNHHMKSEAGKVTFCVVLNVTHVFFNMLQTPKICQTWCLPCLFNLWSFLSLLFFFPSLFLIFLGFVTLKPGPALASTTW